MRSKVLPFHSPLDNTCIWDLVLRRAAEIVLCSVKLERRTQAIFMPFALFGTWDPFRLAQPQKCSGMSRIRFLAMVHCAGLVKDEQSCP